MLPIHTGAPPTRAARQHAAIGGTRLQWQVLSAGAIMAPAVKQIVSEVQNAGKALGAPDARHRELGNRV